MLCIAHDRPLYDAARSRICDEHFQAHEEPLRILWRTYCKVIPEYNAVTFDNLRLTCDQVLRETQHILPPQTLEVIYHPSPDGLLYSMANPPSGMITPPNLALARQILKKFIDEREVIFPLRRVFIQALGAVPLIEDFLERATRKLKESDALLAPPIAALGQLDDAHETMLDNTTRGRQLVGLSTELTELDRRLLGLRGVTILGAGPGVGKTALSLEIALGVCRAHAENDAVVVFLSLEMPKDEIVSRVKCMTAEMDWQTYVLGSGSRQGHAPGEPHFTEADQELIAAGRNRRREQQIDRRLVIADRSDLGDTLSVALVRGIVDQAKQRVGAKRALIIIDYLQLIELRTERYGYREQLSDLEQDRQRIRHCKDIVLASRTADNPLGDAVFVISEARKPVGAAEKRKQQAWGDGLAELMGSARIGYAVDAALTYRRMTDRDIETHYYARTPQAVADRQAFLAEHHISPIILTVEKGRDGTTRGEIPMQFAYHRLQHTELGSREMRLPDADRPSGTGNAPPATAVNSDTGLADLD